MYAFVTRMSTVGNWSTQERAQNRAALIQRDAVVMQQLGLGGLHSMACLPCACGVPPSARQTAVPALDTYLVHPKMNIHRQCLYISL